MATTPTTVPPQTFSFTDAGGNKYAFTITNGFLVQTINGKLAVNNFPMPPALPAPVPVMLYSSPTSVATGTFYTGNGNPVNSFSLEEEPGNFAIPEGLTPIGTFPVVLAP